MCARVYRRCALVTDVARYTPNLSQTFSRIRIDIASSSLKFVITISYVNIGVLALQGAFREHIQILQALNQQYLDVHLERQKTTITTREVRLPSDLDGLDGLIIPGGESTTMVNLMSAYHFWEPLKAFHARGGALWGTCAGAILLAQTVEGYSPNLGQQNSLELLDVSVQRNAFGRQVDSFSIPLDIKGLETQNSHTQSSETQNTAFPAVFIRAPVISQVGQDVEVLARYQDNIVLVRQGRVLASSFHPELTGDSRLHAFFVEQMCSQRTS